MACSRSQETLGNLQSTPPLQSYNFSTTLSPFTHKLFPTFAETGKERIGVEKTLRRLVKKKPRIILTRRREISKRLDLFFGSILGYKKRAPLEVQGGCFCKVFLCRREHYTTTGNARN